jgi:hypothetical protein
VVLWLWWHGPEGETPNLRLFWRAYVRRFDLEHTFRFLKQPLGWPPSGASPRAGRPVDVSGLGRFQPARAGAGVRCGSAAALGASLRHRTPDTDQGPPHRFGAFGGTEDAREAAETLREVRPEGRKAAVLAEPNATRPSKRPLEYAKTANEEFCDELYVHRKTPRD